MDKRSIGFILFIIQFFIGTNLLAQNFSDRYSALSTCGEAIFVDQNWIITNQFNHPSLIQVLKKDSVTDSLFDFILNAKETVVDLKVNENYLIVLTRTQIQKWNLKEQKMVSSFKTYPNISSQWHPRELASGFVIIGNKAIITHGISGISVVNLINGSIEKVQPMYTISSAQDIDKLNDSEIIVAVDNNDSREFRGVYILDINSLSLKRKVFIDNALPLSIRVLDQNRVLIGYLNSIWRFDTSEILNNNSPKPVRRAWKFPKVAVASFFGKTAFFENKMYACFAGLNNLTQSPQYLPTVIELKDVKLDP